MHQRIYKFVETHNILYPSQFGYRIKHSTSHVLINITEGIKHSIDNNKYGCGIFLDLKKAFDTVNHRILLEKLEHYGIRGVVLDWFKSYLENRKQYVTVNGHCAETLNITCGVPQGSVLGPLLFLIYINDLANVSKVLKFHLFADDTNIFDSSSCFEELQSTVIKELKKVSKWLQANRLALNIDKTNFTIFHSAGKLIPYTPIIKINKKPLTCDNFIKYLGVILDPLLSWKTHITELSKKVARSVGIFYKLRYYALIHPFILYGVTIWGLTYPTYMDPILKLQKRFLRIITFSVLMAHSDPLFIRFAILKVHDLHKLQLGNFVFTWKQQSTPAQFKSCFTPATSVHDYNTRFDMVEIQLFLMSTPHIMGFSP